MTDSRAQVRVHDILRFLLELFAFITLGFWGFAAWPLPWPGVLFGIGAPTIAVLVWALFSSPKAVFRLDPFGKAVMEIAVFGAAALAWWSLGFPIVGVIFAVLATVSGVITGRSELR